MPKLSIIVPVYNDEKHIKRCLESIKNQSFKDWECIIIDDGSTDRSYSICESFAVDDDRFKPIHKYNEGPSIARNIGLFLSVGEWVGFCDSDDWVEPNKYERMLIVAEETGSNIVQCGINVYNEDLKLIKKWQLGGLSEDPNYTIEDKRILSEAKYDIGHCWDKIYKKEIIKYIYFPKNIHMCEDTIFNLFAFFNSHKIYSLQEYLHNYIESPNSLAHKNLSKEQVISLKNNINNQIYILSKNPSYKYYDSIITTFFNDIFSRYDFIDYVFPYVDCSKDKWKETYKLTTGVNIDDQRFSGHEEMLRYKFRAMAKWAPWLASVYMLVSDDEQVPEWVNRATVNIVLHKDFIPKEFLPTFNSCTIEMFLQNIPNLEEKFIYGNDDMYMNDIVKPKFFYPEKDKIKMDMRNRKLWHDNDINQIWARIPQNTIALAAKDKPEYIEKYIDGVHLYELPHVDKPMMKSNNQYVYDLYKKEIENSITTLRNSKNLNQYLFTEYAMFHDKAVWEMYRYGYFQVGNDTNKIIEALKATDKRPREICCNEASNSTEEDYNKILIEFRRLYPEKCKYEI